VDLRAHELVEAVRKTEMIPVDLHAQENPTQMVSEVEVGEGDVEN